ncbi:MAG: NfeD family protein, partial [Oscillospiraceae bacterium]|nr:NfeD family protein [Oscillospiraceae bacterium]
MNYWSLTWLIAAVVFGVAEAVTVSLVTIWFAAGAVVAMVAALLGAPVWLQVVLFLAVSVAVLAALRPFAKKYVNGIRRPTNADRVLGVVCPVTEDIDNILGSGTVTVDGKVWSARSAGGETIAAGTLVRPVSIQGVKLIVEAAEAPQK